MTEGWMFLFVRTVWQKSNYLRRMRSTFHSMMSTSPSSRRSESRPCAAVEFCLLQDFCWQEYIYFLCAQHILVLEQETMLRTYTDTHGKCRNLWYHQSLTSSSQEEKLDPKWVPERAKHSGRKIWHEMKGPWRLSPIERNPKITNLFSRRAFLVTPRWWRSTWRFPITDHSWNVDIHARKSKRGRRANQVKSNNSRQISQVK